MHDTAYAIARLFYERYAPPSSPVVVEVGSYNVNGALRDFRRSDMLYIGLDLEVGPGVDVKIGDTPHLPLCDACADLVVASSVFEHDRFFWMTFLEMVRLLKPNGFLYINAPSNGIFHRYPYDCWRFYPDSGHALEAWARKNGYDLTLAECFIANRKADMWNDFCAVFINAKNPSCRLPAPIGLNISATNVFAFGHEGLTNYVGPTEDMRVLKDIRRERDALTKHCAGLRAQNRHLRSLITATVPDDFDPDVYVALHPDIAAAGVDGRQHWLTHGFYEGRRYR
jgi:SAM-dependent methyltransferase